MTSFFVVLAVALSAEPSGHVSLGKVTASDNAAAVTKELKTQVEPLEGCYDLATKDAPSLKGSVTVDFEVDPGSGVTDIKTTEDSVKNETLAQCMMARLRATTWPVKKKALKVTAVFKFH